MDFTLFQQTKKTLNPEDQAKLAELIATFDRTDTATLEQYMLKNGYDQSSPNEVLAAFYKYLTLLGLANASFEAKVMPLEIEDLKRQELNKIFGKK